MTTVAVTPTLGSAPVTLQAGNYSAIDDRRYWGSGMREGAISGGSYQVIQRAAGANMSVDVAMSSGDGCIVTGDSVTAQGRYFVPPTPSNGNVTIAAADATNPRNDLVVLEVKDDQHDAGGLNQARVRVITGTPNASAAATDAPGANGTPALPSSCMPLAHVRVTAGATSVTTAMINDRRSWAGGAPTFVSSLPSPFADGQEVYYQSTTAGTGGGATNSMSSVGATWHLRARSVYSGGNATYPWEFIGGGPCGESSIGGRLYTTYVQTTSLTFVALGSGATAGPQVKVPLAGDYRVDWMTGARQENSGGAAAMRIFKTGDTAGTWETHDGLISTQTSDSLGYMAGSKVLTCAASDVVQHYYASSSATYNARFYNRSLYVTPVRVG